MCRQSTTNSMENRGDELHEFLQSLELLQYYEAFRREGFERLESISRRWSWLPRPRYRLMRLNRLPFIYIARTPITRSRKASRSSAHSLNHLLFSRHHQRRLFHYILRHSPITPSRPTIIATTRHRAVSHSKRIFIGLAIRSSPFRSRISVLGRLIRLPQGPRFLSQSPPRTSMPEIRLTRRFIRQFLLLRQAADPSYCHRQSRPPHNLCLERKGLHLLCLLKAKPACLNSHRQSCLLLRPIQHLKDVLYLHQPKHPLRRKLDYRHLRFRGRFST
ncbi:hypothetical protein IWW57_000754 [Coemansia sp. S610]|nr:hypothetical protein IWW57_000754 [Coemansia sp. S610]